MKCTICHVGDVSPERAEIYSHCTSRNCIAEWRRRRNDDQGLKLMLVPKQGMTWVSDPNLQKTSGRASGK